MTVASKRPAPGGALSPARSCPSPRRPPLAASAATAAAAGAAAGVAGGGKPPPRKPPPPPPRGGSSSRQKLGSTGGPAGSWADVVTREFINPMHAANGSFLFMSPVEAGPATRLWHVAFSCVGARRELRRTRKWTASVRLRVVRRGRCRHLQAPRKKYFCCCPRTTNPSVARRSYARAAAVVTADTARRRIL